MSKGQTDLFYRYFHLFVGSVLCEYIDVAGTFGVGLN